MNATHMTARDASEICLDADTDARKYLKHRIEVALMDRDWDSIKNYLDIAFFFSATSTTRNGRN